MSNEGRMDREERVAEIVSTWRSLRERGQVVDPERWIVDNPDLEGSLREAFAILDLLAIGDEPTSATAAPETLGIYGLVEVLGTGGMGTVYRAQATVHTEVLRAGQTVAVKVFHPHLLSAPGIYKRFLREAEAGRRVRHANVARTYDAGSEVVNGDVWHYLVMEYVPGQTLRALADELKRVPEELCLHMARRLAAALQAIHAEDLVHRDLKPENVLITADREVKVTDLGVAQVGEASIRLSRTNAFVGSLLYAAPEQFSEARVDGRADLYALGLVLYELATGEHPFQADDIASVLHAQIEMEPRRAGDLHPQLSPFFEEVLHTLLAKAPEDRFTSAAVLLEVLAEGEASAWWRERVRSIKAATQEPLRRVRIPRETGLHGREPEEALLREAYDAAREGHGRALLIEGEAGIGKTRLLDEFVTRLQRGGETFHLLHGACQAHGTTAGTGAFIHALRDHLGTDDLETLLARHLPYPQDRIASYAAILRGDAVAHDPVTAPAHALQTMFTRVMLSLAEERPTIVMIEDLHETYEEGRALFAAVAAAARDHRVLLVGASRAGLPDAWLTDLQHSLGLTRIVLSRLGPKDLALLLQEAFHSERIARELAYPIGVKSDGNPYFALEIVRVLKDSPYVRRRPDGRWVTSGLALRLEVPATVTSLIEERIRDLGRQERDLLSAASCQGATFDPVLAGRVIGLPPIDALRTLGSIETEYGLVRSVGRQFAFDHHLLRQSFYDRLPELLREEYHAATAAVVVTGRTGEDLVPEALGTERCYELCIHYLKGGRPGEALRYFDPSLKHLLAAFRHEQALELMDLALRAPGLLGGERRFEVLRRRSYRLDLLGRNTELDASLDELASLAEELDDDAMRAVVELARGDHRLRTSRHEAAYDHFARSLELARTSADPSLEAVTTGRLGNALHALGRLEDAERHHRDSLDLARRSGDRAAEATAMGCLGNDARSLGRLEEAVERYVQHGRLAQEIGDARGLGSSLGNRSSVLRELGRYEESEVCAHQYLAHALRIGDRMGEAMAAGLLGGLAARKGRYEEARERQQHRLEVAEEIGNKVLAASAAGSLGNVLQHLGHLEAARAQHEKHLQISRSIGHRMGEAIALGNLALSCRALGRQGEALERLREALAASRAVKDRLGEAVSGGNLGATLLALGRNEEGGAALASALAVAHEIGYRRGVALITAHVGTLHQREGRLDEAREHYERAIALHEEMGAGEVLAETVLSLASLRIEAGEEEAARLLVEKAASLARKYDQATVLLQTEVVRSSLPGTDAGRLREALRRHRDRVAPAARLAAEFALWRATGERAHLEAASRLLEQVLEDTPAEYRKSMLERVPPFGVLRKALREEA